MNCPNCGAPLRSDQRECAFCGSENPAWALRDTGVKIRVEQRRPDDVVIRAISKVPLETARCLNGPDLEEYIKRQLVRQIAELIVDKKGYRLTVAEDCNIRDLAVNLTFYCEVTVRDYNVTEVRA